MARDLDDSINPDRLAAEVEEEIESPPSSDKIEVRFDHGLVSTGSTLLDLAISGGRVHGGGIPGGIIVEIFGPSGFGKTALLSEICGSAQARGGDIMIADPEARLDKEYARIYGVELDKRRYGRPDTVPELFEGIWNWKPEPREKGAICVYGADSLTALSTKVEMEGSDKYGMRRAKEFSEGLRKTCRIIANNNWLVVLTNQLRGGPEGEFTPGGRGVGYYSSLRIRVGPAKEGWRIDKEVQFEGRGVERVTGIRADCMVKKSTVDSPYRQAPISVVFKYGIDDIRENLQFLKTYTGVTKYPCVGKSYQALNAAVSYVEKHDQEGQIREMAISLWERIEKRFEVNRKPKRR